jgi:hypothetical protein
MIAGVIYDEQRFLAGGKVAFFACWKIGNQEDGQWPSLFLQRGFSEKVAIGLLGLPVLR